MKSTLVKTRSFLAKLTLLLISFSLHAQTDVWQIGKHINVEPKGLDVTFQLLEDFDETQKIVMGWDGEEQLYALAVDQQPGGKEADIYWSGMIKEIKKQSPVDIAHEGEFKSLSGLKISFKVFSSKIDGEPSVQIFYLIKNEKIAYWVIAHVFNIDRVNDVYQQSARLLKSVRLTK